MKNKTKPICTGAGLLALDVLLSDDDLHNPKIYAGGSMGNVVSILAYLGWDSYPIARLSDDYAADEIKSDLVNWGVKTKLVTQTEDGSTPVIIQRNYIDKKGNPKHKFQFKCPVKKEWFPGYKSIIKKSLANIFDSHSKTDVFYFDRVTRANVDMAKFYRNNGALIYFEPSSISVEKQFQEALETCHIVKFANDRINNFNQFETHSKALLEIKTLGKEGLEFRSRLHNVLNWKLIPAFDMGNVKDTSGAGDWFTASLINSIGGNGLERLTTMKFDDIDHYLNFCQTYSAINCQFNGARGAMYNLSSEDLSSFVNQLFNTGVVPHLHNSNNSNGSKSYELLANLLIS